MPNKKNLLLITDGFPYGDSERTFITKEYEIFSQQFNVVTLALTELTEVTHHEPNPGKHYRLSWTKREILGKLSSITDTSLKEELARAPKTVAARKYIVKYHVIARYYEQYIKQIVEEHSIDIIYSYWCTPATLAAVRLYGGVEDKKVAIISRFHGYDLYNERTYGANWQPFRSEITAGLDRFVFVSEYGMNYYKNTWSQVDSDKCLVSYIGTGKHKRIINDHYTFVSCSSCYELKRIDKIIDALALIPDKYQVKWVHVGAGGIFEELKKYASEKLDAKDNITYVFEGFVPNAKLQEIYEKHQVGAYITTSSTEGLPITIVEAQSMGLPTIATDVGGISELVLDIDADEKNATGLLMGSDPTPEEVAQTIIKYCELSYGVRRTMSDNSRTRWGLYHYDGQNATKLAKIFSDV